MSAEPVDLTEWAVTPEQIAASQGRRANGAVGGPPTKADRIFVQYQYKAQLELARSSRNALLAVQAELYHLHFKSWDKTASIELGNAVFRVLGFSHADKIRALKELEKAGWIAVQWRDRKSPLVTLLKGFKL